MTLGYIRANIYALPLCASIENFHCIVPLQNLQMEVAIDGPSRPPYIAAGCSVNSARDFVLCPAGQGVLSDGDIGPTASVNVSDPDQVKRFFVWHRDNGTVGLEYRVDSMNTRFDVSYIDVYTLSVPSARIGSPGTTRFSISGIPL